MMPPFTTSSRRAVASLPQSVLPCGVSMPTTLIPTRAPSMRVSRVRPSTTRTKPSTSIVRPAASGEGEGEASGRAGDPAGVRVVVAVPAEVAVATVVEVAVDAFVRVVGVGARV
jgi:hypothetical protein